MSLGFCASTPPDNFIVISLESIVVDPALVCSYLPPNVRVVPEIPLLFNAFATLLFNWVSLSVPSATPVKSPCILIDLLVLSTVTLMSPVESPKDTVYPFKAAPNPVVTVKPLKLAAPDPSLFCKVAFGSSATTDSDVCPVIWVRFCAEPVTLLTLWFILTSDKALLISVFIPSALSAPLLIKSPFINIFFTSELTCTLNESAATSPISKVYPFKASPSVNWIVNPATVTALGAEASEPPNIESEPKLANEIGVPDTDISWEIPLADNPLFTADSICPAVKFPVSEKSPFTIINFWALSTSAEVTVPGPTEPNTTLYPFNWEPGPNLKSSPAAVVLFGFWDVAGIELSSFVNE